MILLAFAALMTFEANAVRTWEDLPAPLWGNSQVNGAYQAGCAFESEEIDPSTPLWEVVKISRNRYYGQPELLAFLNRLGAHAKQMRYGKIVIGDTALPGGGKLAYGHASHQMGIEADIRFDFYNGSGLTMSQRNSWEEVPIAEVKELGPGKGWESNVIEILYRDEYMDLVRAAAEDPKVNRIFISPPLKKRMCDLYTSPGNYPAWLLKVRPYYGHTAHFHVRLNCPENSPGCVDSGLPTKDPTDMTEVGCAGNSLHWWLTGIDLAPDPNPPLPAPAPKMPSVCKQALAAAVVVSLPSQIKCLTKVVGTGSARRTHLRCHDYLRHRNFTAVSNCTPTVIQQRPQPCVTVPP